MDHNNEALEEPLDSDNIQDDIKRAQEAAQKEADQLQQIRNDEI